MIDKITNIISFICFSHSIHSLYLKGTLDQLTMLKVTFSNKPVLSKLDVLGQSFVRHLKTAKKRISNENLKTKKLQRQSVLHFMFDLLVYVQRNAQLIYCQSKQVNPWRTTKSTVTQALLLLLTTSIWKSHRKNMTIAKQNRDVHWVNISK